MTKKKVVEEPSLPEPETVEAKEGDEVLFQFKDFPQSVEPIGGDIHLVPLGPGSGIVSKADLKALLDEAPRLPWGFMPPEIVKQYERPYREWLEVLRQLVQ